MHGYRGKGDSYSLSPANDMYYPDWPSLVQFLPFRAFHGSQSCTEEIIPCLEIHGKFIGNFVDALFQRNSCLCRQIVISPQVNTFPAPQGEGVYKIPLSFCVFSPTLIFLEKENPVFIHRQEEIDRYKSIFLMHSASTPSDHFG